jgi:hypothetical protein
MPKSKQNSKLIITLSVIIAVLFISNIAGWLLYLTKPDYRADYQICSKDLGISKENSSNLFGQVGVLEDAVRTKDDDIKNLNDSLKLCNDTVKNMTPINLSNQNLNPTINVLFLKYDSDQVTKIMYLFALLIPISIGLSLFKFTIKAKSGWFEVFLFIYATLTFILEFVSLLVGLDLIHL